jgi:DNA (cytosine-5)-methyltransferase 1
MVEGEAFAAGVLAARMAEGCLDDAPIWSDLKTFDGKAWRGVVDTVIAGIPCQPHSVAGKRQGAADERDLWPDTLRILRDVQPRYFFLENVPGVLGYLSERIVPDLLGDGWRVPRPLLLEAASVGASHRRERVFLLAYAAGERGTSGTRDGSGLRDGRRLQGLRARGDVEHGNGGLFAPGPSSGDWPAILRDAPWLAPALSEAEIESLLRGVASGDAGGLDFANRVDRLRGLGNLVVPLQGAVAFTLLMRRLNCGS